MLVAAGMAAATVFVLFGRPVTGTDRSASGLAASAAVPRLVFCGSSTLGERLVPSLVAGWLGAEAPAEGQQCQRGKTRHDEPIEVCVSWENSDRALEQLADGTCDIGMYSELWDSEAHPQFRHRAIGWDAIMVITSVPSPLNSVSIGELAQWYANPNRVLFPHPANGTPVRLTVYGREAGSGTTHAFERMIGLSRGALRTNRSFGKRALAEVLALPGPWVYFLSASELERHAHDAMFDVVPIRTSPDDVRGTYPTPETMAPPSPRYPLVRPLFLLWSAADSVPRGPITKQFLDYVASPQAAPRFEALRMLHPTSYDPKAVKGVTVPPTCGIGAVFEGARLDWFEYPSGADELPIDMKARLREDLASAMANDHDLVVVGWSDTRGPPDCDLSGRRAEKVRAELERLRDEWVLPSARPIRIQVLNGGPSAEAPGSGRVTTLYAVHRP